MLELDGFRQISGWVTTEIAYPDAAVEIAANVVTDTAAAIGTHHTGAEHGRTMAPINMMAPAAHVRAWPGAVVEHAPQL